VSLALLMMLGIFIVAVWGGLPRWVLSASVVIGVVALMLWHQRRVRRAIVPTLRLTLISEGRCASCGYDLGGSLPQEDGCTVCPECDAAWRISAEMVEFRKARERLAAPERTEGETASDRASRDWLRSVQIGLGCRRTYAARDAHGRMVDLVNPGVVGPRPARWVEVPPPERGRLRRRLYFNDFPLRVLLALLFAPSLVFGAWMLLRTPPAALLSPSLYLVSALLQMVFFSALIVGLLLNPLSRGGKGIVPLMLEEGHCPSCAAKLPAIKGEEIVTCAACRAAWKPEKCGAKVGKPPAPARTTADDAWFRPVEGRKSG
jgi:hypothetical protein